MQDQIGYFMTVHAFTNSDKEWVGCISDNEGGINYFTKRDAKYIFPQWDGNAGFKVKLLTDEEAEPLIDKENDSTCPPDDYVSISQVRKIIDHCFLSVNIQDDAIPKQMVDFIKSCKPIGDIKPEYPHNGYAKPVWWID